MFKQYSTPRADICDYHTAHFPRGQFMYRILSCLLAVALFSACATIPNTSIENMEGEIPAGSGLVIAETVTNGERITGVVRQWTEIILVRVNYEGEDDTFSIDSLSHSFSTQAYMGIVPAGTYRVGALYAFLRRGDYTFTAYAIAPPALGTFNVEAGRVTNLGTILYQPFQDRNWAEDAYPDYAMSRIANDSLWQTARKSNSQVASQITAGAPVLGWNPDKFDEIRGAAATMIKNAGLPTRLHRLADGSILMSGHLGGLYLLRDGAVLDRSAASHYKITDLAELPGGRFLVGGEFGQLFVTYPLAENIRHLSLDEDRAHVLDIELSDSGKAYVAVVAPDGYTVYRYRPGDDSLVSIKSFPPKKIGFFEQGYDTYAEELRHPNLLGTPAGVAVFFEKVVYRYDESTDQWSESESVEFDTMHRQADGVVSGIPWSSWSGTMPPRYSTDDGRSWQETDEKGGLLTSWKVPTYRFANGNLIRTGDDADFSLWKGYTAVDEVPVLLSQDNGANWVPVGSVPRGCTMLAPEVSADELLYILCTDGSTLSSADRGATWQQSSPKRIPEFDEFPGALKIRFNREKLDSTSPPPPVIPK